MDIIVYIILIIWFINIPTKEDERVEKILKQMRKENEEYKARKNGGK